MKTKHIIAGLYLSALAITGVAADIGGCPTGNATATNIEYYINGKKVSTLKNQVLHNSTHIQVRFRVPKGSTPTRFSLVVYTMPDSVFDESTSSDMAVADQDSREFRSGKHRLDIVTPNDFFEVDFVKGCVLDPMGPEGSNNFYSKQNRLIGQAYGGKACKTCHKITICHIPPGNPSNAHTITVDNHSWPAHQSHGDYMGECRQDTTVICDTCGSTGGLPVKLIKFEANKTAANVVELKWATASEVNNDYIAIEKSTDINNWSEVCRVHGAPGGFSQTTREYSCKDENVKEVGQNLVYYRPKQVDFNGTYEYFNVIKLRLQDAAYATTIENAYPNPTSDRIHIRYNTAENGLFNIRVVNLDGKIILHNSFVATPGTSVVDLDLPETKLNKGFYILEVQNEDTVFRQKIYKE